MVGLILIISFSLPLLKINTGVNDSPSLKKADCGIAVEGASEAAQAAADIVFLAPGLSTIVLAIKTAREIFQRMKAYIQYRVSENNFEI